MLTYFPDELEFSKHNFIYKLGFFNFYAPNKIELSNIQMIKQKEEMKI